MLLTPGCDLLSICSLTIFDTTCFILVDNRIKLWFAFNLFFDDIWYNFAVCICLPCRLWFAFNLFFDDIWYNTKLLQPILTLVVICFQFVLWRYLIQLQYRRHQPLHCCDLLSICSLTIFDTTILFLNKRGVSCDLLSICSLTIFDTTEELTYKPTESLWFAFNLFFDDIWYNLIFKLTDWMNVVICFQFVLWRYLIQPLLFLNKRGVRCDLLSICSLTIFDTTKS